MPELRLEAVSKSFPRPAGGEVWALRAFSLTVPPGALFAVVGPSGCGKTTLLRLLAGLETPTSGRIWIGGREAAGLDPAARDLGLVFQNHALYPHLTVRENLELGLEARRVDKVEIRRRSAEMADLFGLRDTLGCLPGELSGGMRQRAALARACARRPGALLLDEPCAHLDPETRREARMFLARLWRELRMTLIWVTHDQSEAMAVGEQVLVMRDGTRCQLGTPREVYGHPENAFVARFMGLPPMNLFRGRFVKPPGSASWAFEESGSSANAEAKGTRLRLMWPEDCPIPGALSTGREVLLGARPEHLALESVESLDETNGDERARIEHVEWLGAETVVHFSTAFHEGTARCGAVSKWAPGVSARVRLCRPEAIRWFDAATQGRLAGGEVRSPHS